MCFLHGVAHILRETFEAADETRWVERSLLEMGRVYVLCGPAQLSSDVVSLTSVMHIVLERSNGGFPHAERRARNDGEGCSMGSKPTDRQL